AEPRISGDRVAGGVERPDDVARRRGDPVVPPHTGLQPERERRTLGRPRPAARKVRLGDEGRIVAREGGEQHVALHLLRERVRREERVHALEIGAGGIDDCAPATRGAHPARQRRPGEQHPPHRPQHARILAAAAGAREIRRMLAEAGPATLELVGLSLLLSYLLGVAVGAVQATAHRRVDTALSVATVTLFAVPGYWLGLMLVMVFTYWARALPAFGRAGLDSDFLSGGAWLADRLRHLVLPLTTLTLIGIGGAARFVRGAMLDVVGQPFVRTALAKGLAPFRVAQRHVARNALIPVVVLLGLSVPTLFSGAVFVEFVFAWPGVGRRLVEAVRT